MQATRKQAQKAYDAALEKVRSAENGTDFDAWEKANAELAAARTALIAAEQANPTPAEIKRQNEKLRLRNRGMDV